jgi:hypothetical protein
MKMKDSVNHEAVSFNDFTDYLLEEISRLKEELFFYSCECVALGKPLCSEAQRKSDHSCGWRASEALRARIPDTLGD